MDGHLCQAGIRRRLAWSASLLCCVLLVLLVGDPMVGEPVWANGNVSADETLPPVKKSVQKAPIKRAPVKKKIGRSKKNLQQKRIRKATSLRPRVSSLQQGVALMRQDRYEAAYPWLQKAVQEERRNPEAWYWYGMYHEKTAQFEQAQFFYRKAMELDPGFEPFSRVVVYPGDGERVPLWDPKRPARVYPIPTNDHGIAIIPPDSPQARRRPVRPPIDPELPKVPVYTPPEPGAGPFDGDAWQPSIYVPPGRERLMEGGEPVYMPPESRVVPLTPPPPVGMGGISPVGGGPAAVRPPLSPVSPAPPVSSVHSPQAPEKPLPAGGAAGSGNVPVYQPPLPGIGDVAVAAVSQDQPVYQPPMPPEIKK